MRARSAQVRSDRGFTLVELMVVMSLLGLALTMFATTLNAMGKSASAQEEIGQATDGLLVSFSELERQVRNAYWLKVSGSGDQATLYSVNGAGRPFCVSWRITSTSLERDDGAGWRVVWSGQFLNSASTPAFVAGDFLTVADATATGQYRNRFTDVASSLTLDFRIGQGVPATEIQLKSQLSARNVPRRGGVLAYQDASGAWVRTTIASAPCP